MRHIWRVLGLKKNSPLIAVRIEVLCFYTLFNNFKIFVFSGYQMELHSKGSQFSIFFNSWQWFSPSWCQVFQWKYIQKCIFSKSPRFFKNLMTSDDKWWWVMMSDDEWWWVMRSDDEWWGVMMRDNELWWVMISDGK